MLPTLALAAAITLTTPAGTGVTGGYSDLAVLPHEEIAHVWSAYYGNDGSWYIRGGKNTFVKMPDERTANKTAKQFNKIEKKAKKAAGVWDDGSAPCSDVTDGVEC